MKVNEKLKLIREQKKITQSQIGDFLGYTYSNIKEIEAGRTKLGLDVFLKMCKFYDVNPLELLKEDDNYYVILNENELQNIKEAIKTLQAIEKQAFNNGNISINNSSITGNEIIIGNNIKKN